MSDILDFMDSVALREHLQKTGYALQPLERAYVVRHSRKRSLTEKLAAMRELLNTSPDFELPVDEYTDGNNRFHVLLREWIDTKQKTLDEFLRADKNFVYSYLLSAYNICRRSFYDMEHFDTVFADFDTCRAACRDDLGYFDRADALSPERPAEIRVIRQETRPEHEETTIYADLNENAEVMDITCLPDWSDGAFWSMDVSFPSPFSAGELIYPIAPCTTDRPAVYLGKGAELSASDRFLPAKVYPDRAYALTYNADDGVLLLDEIGTSVLDLDRFSGELPAEDRMLCAVSAYVKGEIRLDELFTFDRIARADIAADRMREKVEYAELLHLRDKVSPPKIDMEHNFRDHIVPAIGIKPSGRPAKRPSASHFGGKPFVPPDFVWPCYSETDIESGEKATRPLAFLAQMNLAETAPFDTQNRLPYTGMLYFFYEPESRQGKKAGEGFARVFYEDNPEESLEIRDFPKELREEYRIPESALSFRAQNTMDNAFFTAAPDGEMAYSHIWGNHSLREVAEIAAQFGISVEKEYDEDGNAFADLPASCCHLLGAPDSLDFPDSVLDTVAKLYEKPFSMDTLLEEGSYSSPDPDDWVLLAQFPSFSDGVDFGCVGLIDFCIRKDDLRKKDFARARMLLQNCEQ